MHQKIGKIKTDRERSHKGVNGREGAMWCPSFINALRIIEEKWCADKTKCQLIGGKVKKALKVEFVFPV